MQNHRKASHQSGTPTSGVPFPLRRSVYRSLRGLAAGLIVITLGGCATVHPTDPYGGLKPRAEQLASPDTTEAITTAPAPPPTENAPSTSTQGLSLDECIALALTNNPEVAAATWDRKASLAEKDVQAGARWPNLHLTGSYFHVQDGQFLVPPSKPGAASYFTKDLVSTDLVARLPLYAGGRIVNGIQAAALLAQSADHRLARTRRELVFNVSSIFYSIEAQRHVIESLEFSRSVLENHVKRVRGLIEAEKAAKVDALRTDVRLADIEQQLFQEGNALAIQFRLLANALGISNVAASALDIRGTLDMPDATAAESDVAQALVQRQDYAAAKAALEAQAKRVDIARGAREPQVNLEASYGGRWGLGGSGDPVLPSSNALSGSFGTPSGIAGTNTRSLSRGRALSTTVSPGGITTRLTQSGVAAADDFEDVGRVGITLDIPLFEGGALRAGVRKERAQLRAARERLRKLALQIRLEVETAALNVASARARAVVLHKSIVEAKESLRIEREKYDFGKGTIIDVLDAQSALITAQTNHYQALRDYHTALVALQLAMGEIETGATS